MREIKFRAWHKLANRMCFIDMLDFTLGAYRATEGKSSGSGHLADIELMQYTGLLDKNGKEIYEGDIVTSHTPFDHWNDNISLVKYEEGTWNYSYAIQEFSDHPERDWEIIGNIYEHPELLAGTSNEKEQP